MLTSPKKVPLILTESPLDRAGDFRADPNWLERKRRSPAARFLPLWRLQPLLTGPADTAEAKLAFLPRAACEKLGPPDAQEVFLGLGGHAAYFARDISGEGDTPAAPEIEAHFREPRAALEILPAEETAIFGQAKALLDWHRRHQFCAACGSATVSADAGYGRECAHCGANHFPRTDPAAIMLVTRGDRCLLARNRRFGTAHNHSALAGFVEPGESIEDCVRREVLEEVGIVVGSVRYVASQPWPFPSSLMIGCFAEGLSEEIKVDGSEIFSARWFDRETIRSLLGGAEIGGVKLPRPFAIAFHLIKSWAEE